MSICRTHAFSLDRTYSELPSGQIRAEFSYEDEYAFDDEDLGEFLALLRVEAPGVYEEILRQANHVEPHKVRSW